MWAGAVYALRLSLRTRAVLACVVAGLVYAVGTLGFDAFPPGLAATGNVWDVIFNTLSQRPLTLIWAPLFLLVVVRPLGSATESLVVTRLGRRERWWLGDVLAIGGQAVAYLLIITLASWLVGATLASPSWRWSALDLYAEVPHHGQFIALAMPPLRGMAPAAAALVAVALLVLLFWALGVLAHALTLLVRSPWLGIVLVEAVLLVALFFIGQAVRWLPAGQFVLADHGQHGRLVGLAWSVIYGLAFLALGTLGGAAVALERELVAAVSGRAAAVVGGGGRRPGADRADEPLRQVIVGQVRVDLAAWWGYRPNPLLLLIGCAAAFGTRHTGLVATSALAGPNVTVGPGGLVEVDAWSWLLVMATYAAASGGTLSSGVPGWTRLELCRSGRRMQWVAGKLLAALVLSVAYLAALVAATALGTHAQGAAQGPAAPRAVLDLVGLGVALVGIAWFKVVLELLPGGARVAVVVLLAMLALAALGGALAPAMPFAQAIVALHAKPGTLGAGAGLAYGVLWAAACAAAAAYRGISRASW